MLKKLHISPYEGYIATYSPHTRHLAIGFFFGYISVLKYTHFFKKMGILQMGIFPIFLKNGYIFQIFIPQKVLLLKNNTFRF